MSAVKGRRYYVRVFEENVDPPWVCEFCKYPVETLRGPRTQDGAIHHLDHDKSNNRLTNLVAAHKGCHSRHHNEGIPARHGYTAEIRARMGRPGYAHVESKLRCHCGLLTRAGPMKRHTLATGHALNETASFEPGDPLARYDRRGGE